MDMVDVLDVVLASAGGVGGDVFISCVGCVGARLVAANAWGESKRASEQASDGGGGMMVSVRKHTRPATDRTQRCRHRKNEKKS